LQHSPLTDVDQVAVIKVGRHKLTGSIATPGHPTAIVLAGSYGVCHRQPGDFLLS
jgi:hypothetical protein